MHKKLLVSKYTAIIQLIHGQLAERVSIYALPERNNPIEKKDIPLSKGKSDIRISYISGVALQLSKSHNSEPFLIASSIAVDLSVSFDAYLMVEVLPKGLIQMQVTDLFVAVWLQDLIDKNRSIERAKVKHLDLGTALRDCVFSIQYVHARCCSLLRLAQKEKLIDFNIYLNEHSSESIPWLDDDGKLRLNHHNERRLIVSLVKIIDELEPIIARPLKWQGAAMQLVTAFEGFWSTCRIHDDVTAITPEIVKARIGLIAATQSVLRFLLEEKLGIPACLEL
ncbi:MAG: DALR anticodon-binding domain-containing protein [Cyanobacteriota bacterium]|nr:DALR anticodon-binding domain-containing protein [Cyanobacteriota bacterium]